MSDKSEAQADLVSSVEAYYPAIQNITPNLDEVRHPEPKPLSHIDEIIVNSPEKLQQAFENDITKRISEAKITPISEADPELVKDAAEKVIRFEEELGEIPLNQDPEETPEDEEFDGDPLEGVSESQIASLMRQMRDMMGFLESQWQSSKEEFKLTDVHMRELYDFNEQNRIPPPEDYDEDADDADDIYDRFNGLNLITYEKVLEIFGNGHPIIAVEIDENKVADPESTGVLNIHQITIDRIKSVVQDFFAWMSSVKQYRQIHDAYMELVEIKEKEQIDLLLKKVEEEEDPKKKEKLQEALDMYYNRKYLDFLAEPLDEETVNRLVKAFSDEGKINYWLNKTRDKLKQMKLSEKFILEISQFEKRFLDEKYHHQSNILLLYFLSMASRVTAYSHKDPLRTQVVCMVIGLDKFIRNTLHEDDRIRVLHNIEAFQNQFLDKLPRGENNNE